MYYRTKPSGAPVLVMSIEAYNDLKKWGAETPKGDAMYCKIKLTMVDLAWLAAGGELSLSPKETDPTRMTTLVLDPRYGSNGCSTLVNAAEYSRRLQVQPGQPRLVEDLVDRESRSDP